MTDMEQRFRDRVVFDLALYEDDLRTWRERVVRGFVKREHAECHITFATGRIASDRRMLKRLERLRLREFDSRQPNTHARS